MLFFFFFFFSKIAIFKKKKCIFTQILRFFNSFLAESFSLELLCVNLEFFDFPIFSIYRKLEFSIFLKIVSGRLKI